jgi:hypothetical protein
VFAHQRRIFILMIDCAVVRKLLTNGVINLIGYLAGLLYCPADYDGGEISDINRGSNHYNERYQQGYQRNLPGTDAEA